MRVAFVVGIFPAPSETFIINQVADLLDRGVDVQIFAFRRGGSEFVSQRYHDCKMAARTHYLEMPKNRIKRVIRAVPKIIHLLKYTHVLRKLLYMNLRFLFWSEPFVGKQFDIVHCHFGTIATDYLTIKDIVGIPAKIVTTFYGYDVSMIYKKQPATVYDRLIHESSYFLAMSNNMKDRMISHGFPANRVHVLPVSIDVDSYPFAKRVPSRPFQILSVGRFVEKKGFDDLFRALAIVKEKKDVKCTIVGGGPLEQDLKKLVCDLNLRDSIDFKGYMKIEEIIQMMPNIQLFVQPSKTAKNGDME